MTDPCAMRLHDLAGALLLYHATYGMLPPSLAELREVPSLLGPLETFKCPASAMDYQYDPNGERKRDRVLLLYDPAPAHEGKRRAVELIESKPNQPLVTKVIALPEEYFSGGPAR